MGLSWKKGGRGISMPSRKGQPVRGERSPFVVLGGALVVIAAGAALWSGACDRRVSNADCKEMLDRYVDMTIAADPALASLPASQAQAVREMKRALKKGEKSYRQVEEQCEREVRRHEYRCAMKAPTPNDWEACID